MPSWDHRKLLFPATTPPKKGLAGPFLHVVLKEETNFSFPGCCSGSASNSQTSSLLQLEE